MPITNPVPQRGTRLRRDQVGKLSIVVKIKVATLEETLTVGAETVLGYPEIDRDATQEEAGAGLYLGTITYGGLDSRAPLAQGRDGGLWSGRITIREEPIETIQNFDVLKAKYQGEPDENGKIVWPAQLSQKGSSGAGLSGKSKTSKNPMYGVSTFPVFGEEVEHRYMVKQEPTDLFDRVGRVLTQLPKGGPKPPKDYVWITMLPEWEQHGNAWEVRDRYLLVHKENYQSVVYQVIQR